MRTRYALARVHGKGTTVEQNIALALSQLDPVRRAAFKNVGIEFNNVRSEYLYEYAGFAAEPDGFQTSSASKKRKVTQTIHLHTHTTFDSYISIPCRRPPPSHRSWHCLLTPW
jgi:hypothetical protein